eukprot:TRINITY_DN5962_c0_g1_i1.p1 TRINITY_DN5962_c0_g1~~TRINITY_DN5962_c0_g1_i1.p1  ORF type:complete len:440 (+),score=40.09 TRINITY_DN5962_c0_g1_i1:88-1320(+)
MGTTQAKHRAARQLRGARVQSVTINAQGALELHGDRGEIIMIKGSKIGSSVTASCGGGVSTWDEVEGVGCLAALVPFEVPYSSYHDSKLHIGARPLLVVTEDFETVCPPSHCDIRENPEKIFKKILDETVNVLPGDLVVTLTKIVSISCKSDASFAEVHPTPNPSEHSLFRVKLTKTDNKVGVSYDKSGKITKILRTGPGYKAGLRENMVIRYVSGTRVATDKDIESVFKNQERGWFPVVCELSSILGGYSSEESSMVSEGCSMEITDVPIVGSLVVLCGVKGLDGALARLVSAESGGLFTAVPLRDLSTPPVTISLGNLVLTHPHNSTTREFCLFIEKDRGAEVYGITCDEFMTVTEVVPKSPAHRAGIRPGQRVHSAGFETSLSQESLSKLLESTNRTSLVMLVSIGG